MSFASKYNRGSVFQCDTEGFEYKNLRDLYKDNGADQIYPIQGLYINKKSEFGDAPAAICDAFFVNLPAHLLGDCQDMLKDSEAIADIKAGKVGFIIETYQKQVGKTNKTCHGIKWVDID